MTDQSIRLPHAQPRVRHHEVDVEPHAHPGDPRTVPQTDHETGWREPTPRFTPAPRHSERPSAPRDRY